MSHCTQQDGVGFPAFPEGIFRQGIAGPVDGNRPDQSFFEDKFNLFLFPDHGQQLQGLPGHLRPDPVTRQNGDLKPSVVLHLCSV